jgi:hypothetical protein
MKIYTIEYGYNNIHSNLTDGRVVGSEKNTPIHYSIILLYICTKQTVSDDTNSKPCTESASG